MPYDRFMRRVARLAFAFTSAITVLAWLPARAHAQTVAAIAARGLCETSGVEPLSRQLVDTQMCLRPGAFVAFAPRAGITLTSTRVHPFLVASARDAVWAAAARVTLQVTSAFRTLADQYVLYHSGACGLAATPGTSNHESGRAVDISNYSAALSALTGAGCVHPYPGSDPVHFDCPGADSRAESIRAFQHLWNVNNPGDMIAEDGMYGPMTDSRLARSPAGAFPMAGCAAAIPEWGAAFVGQSFPAATAGAVMMQAGASVDAYIDLRNIGMRAWNSTVRLATTQPRDRTSPFAGADWPAPNRPATVAGTIARGMTYRFQFQFHAPATPGTYTEHFGVVAEGSAWFSDRAQGGPPDTLLEARIIVSPASAADAATPTDAAADGGSSTDDGVPPDSSEIPDGADAGDAASRDTGFMRLPDGALVPIPGGGCACNTPGGGSGAGTHGVALLLSIALAFSVRHRRDGSRKDNRESGRWGALPALPVQIPTARTAATRCRALRGPTV